VNRATLLIVGAGPVGLALGCACEGFDVEIVDAAPQPQAPSDAFDLRVFALSPGTRSLLREIGAWEAMDRARISPIRRMAVYGDAGSSLEFAPPPGESLAWIVEGDRLRAGLEAAIASRPWIRARHAARVEALAASAGGASAVLAGGEALAADLLVGADGPDSRVRTDFDIPFEEEAYGESAVVAHFDVERPHGGTARQWFRADGVLAWLPLPGNRISIVWSARQAMAEELCALPSVELERRVRDAGGDMLGEMRLASKVARFALRVVRVADPVRPGVALVGDAAHTVHPLAGQGVNLGFQDVRALAQTLEERSPLERPGDLSVLRRYARARREDIAAMQFVTHGLDQLFAARGPAIAALRNFGLKIVDRQPWIKRALAAQAMR
jgi:2-octaprenyl-6-methoxyphenol hydroxylase